MEMEPGLRRARPRQQGYDADGQPMVIPAMAVTAALRTVPGRPVSRFASAKVGIMTRPVAFGLNVDPNTGGLAIAARIAAIADALTTLYGDIGMNTFVFWPSGDRERQSRIFAEEVVPAVREALASPSQVG
jgi:hypothetical protein